MSINNSTIGWGIIGRSSGLQTKTAGCIAGFDIKNLVDIHNTYINIYPNTELYCFFRENRNNCTVSYYLNYRPAKEIKSDRNGAFYGSVLVLVNSKVEPVIAYSVLKELSDYLGTFINSENKFVKNIDDIEVIHPTSLSNISTSLSPISPNIIIGNNEGFMLIENLDKNNICSFFSIAEETNTTHYFSKVYASSSREIAEFVKSRKKIIAFEPTTLRLQYELDKVKSEKIIMEKQLGEVINEKNISITEYQQRYNNLITNSNFLKEENSRLKIKIQEIQDKGKFKTHIENLTREINQLKSEKIKYIRENEDLKNKYNQIWQLKQFGSQSSNSTYSDENNFMTSFNEMAEAILSNPKKLILPVIFIVSLGILIYIIYYLLKNH